MDSLGFTLGPEPDKGKDCKGQVFRGYSSLFYHKGRLERREGIRLMKSLSCPGCGVCGGGWAIREINDHIEYESLLMSDIEHGKLYGIRVANKSYDWESGTLDGYDLEVHLLP